MSLLSGLVACYGLQEASGSRYSHNGLNTLTDVNTVGQGVGKVGPYSADFERDNSEYLSSASTDFDFSTAATFSLWLNPESAPSAFPGIIGKGLYATDGAYQVDWDDGNNYLLFRTSTSATDFSTYGRYEGTALTVGTYSHWVMVYDGSQSTNATRLVAYKDGLAVTLNYSGTIPATLRTSAANFMLGNFNGLGRYWDGLMNQVILWNRPLVSSEVATLNNRNNGLAFPFDDPLKTVLRGNQRRRRNVGAIINERQPL